MMHLHCLQMLKHLLSIMRASDGENGTPLPSGALGGPNAVDVVHSANCQETLPQCMIGKAGRQVTDPNLEAMDEAILNPLHDRSAVSCKMLHLHTLQCPNSIIKTVLQCLQLAVLQCYSATTVNSAVVQVQDNTPTAPQWPNQNHKSNKGLLEQAVPIAMGRTLLLLWHLGL